MIAKKILEQHIAVFGERGSGKTVLVSSFYGLAQEEGSKSFDVIAEKPEQGTNLHQNFLGMKNSAKLPSATKFNSEEYSFRIQRHSAQGVNGGSQTPNLRIVWHDYPGEWFTESHEEGETKRKVQSFRKLLQSDVALLLVDGQKMLDNQGEEERYLKALLTTFKNSLQLMKDDLLEKQKGFEHFPRIWIIALSKADLLPDLDVVAFRELVIEKAGGEVNSLRNVLAGYVTHDEVLAFGADFMRISSAEFLPNKINTNKHFGIDLILPIAAILPFQRFSRWIKLQLVPAKLATRLLSAVPTGLNFLMITLLTKGNRLRNVGLIAQFANNWLNKDTLDGIIDSASEQARKLSEQAAEKNDFLTAALIDFARALDEAETERYLLRDKA